MITLFRRIRQKLINSGSVTKYLIYAIGEILLVVIGILIALQVNNWNEQRKDHNKSEETISVLRVELEELKDELADVYAFNVGLITVSESYLSGSLRGDSLINNPEDIINVVNFNTITFDVPVFQREMSSDNFIIEEDSLFRVLRRIKTGIKETEENTLYLDEIWNNQVVPYLVKQQAMVSFNRFFRGQEFSTQIALQLFSDAEYKNLAAIINSFLVRYNGQSKRVLDDLEEAISYLSNRN